MNKKNTHIDWRIFRKAVADQLNSDEKKYFDVWYQEDAKNRNYFKQAVRYHEQKEKADILEEQDYRPAFEAFLRQTMTVKKSYWRYLQVAASVAVMIASGWVGYIIFSETPKYQAISEVRPIQPVEGKVELILSSGKKVLLEKIGESNIQEKEGEIHKKDGTVEYLDFQKHGKKTIQYNTVNVPRGTDFKLVLSDSTVVWLNAESSITYPVQFAGNIRKVLVTGEAYFDVTPNKEKPFVVEAGGTNIEVLGTEFNINAYEEESRIYTTLIEGKVLVDNGFGKNVVILPNEQAVTGASADVIVNEVDVSTVIDWKLGMFDFEDERLDDILSELARWYDLKIFFDSEELKGFQFTGGLSRYEDVNQLLQLFEMTKSVKFYIKDDVMLVRKYQ